MPPRLGGNLLAFAGALLWSSAFPATDYLLRRGAWDPVLLVAGRLGGAALFLLALLLLLGRAGELRRLPLAEAVLVGAVGVAAPVLLLVLGQSRSDQVTAAILGTTSPVFAVLLAWALDGERPGRRAAAGIALAVLGGSVASFAGAGGAGGGRAVAWGGGEILVLAATGLWIWYARAALRRLGGPGGGGDLAVAAATQAVGALTVLLLLPALLAAGLARPVATLSAPMLGALAWMSTTAIGLSTFLWLAASRRLGVTVAAIHLNLAPFYVMVLALAAGGRVGLGQAVGGALVASGALLAQLGGAGGGPLRRR